MSESNFFGKGKSIKICSSFNHLSAGGMLKAMVTCSNNGLFFIYDNNHDSTFLFALIKRSVKINNFEKKPSSRAFHHTVDLGSVSLFSWEHVWAFLNSWRSERAFSTIEFERKLHIGHLGPRPLFVGFICLSASLIFSSVKLSNHF